MRLAAIPLLIPGLLPAAARAEPPASVQVEISFLLGYVEGSGCDFYRNGSWHDAKAAQAHLREKYMFLWARNQIKTAEDFIDKAGSTSSFSGQPYQIRCNGKPPVASRQWLGDELARLRRY